jgi:RNA polymerase sigma factor (sigma-70 family)
VYWDKLSARELIFACTQPASDGAWREFIRRYHHILHAAAARVAECWGRNSRQEVQDILQEIYLKLCDQNGAVLASFSDPREAAFFGFLKVIATNTALDYFRNKAARKRGASATGPLDTTAEPPSAEPEPETRIAIQQLEELMMEQTRGVNEARDRSIFLFYYRYGFSAKAISALASVNLTEKGVEGVLHRITASIRNQLASAQGKSRDSRLKEGRVQ